MAINSSYDNALSVAVPYFVNEFKDAVTTAAPTLAAFTELGGVLKTGGGKQIVMPLRLAASSAVIVTNPASVATTGADNTITAANYDWAEVYSALNVPYSEINQLGNNAASMDAYIQAKVKGSISDIGKLINDSLFASATAPSTSAIGSFEQAIAASGVAFGIPASGSANWTSTVVTSAGTLTLDLVLKYLGVITANGGKPSLIVTTPTLWAKMASLAQVSQQVVSTNAKPGDFGIGFQSFYFYGCKVVADNACSAGCMYILSTDDIKIAVDNDVKVDEVVVERPVRFWRFLQHTQLCLACRKTQVKIAGLS